MCRMLKLLCFFFAIAISLSACDGVEGASDSDLLVASFLPENNSADISTTTDITILFNRPVLQDGWMILINDTPVMSGSFDVSGKILTITPSQPFNRDEHIEIELINFVSAEDVNIILGEDNRFFSFNTTPEPSFSISPMNGTTEIEVDSNIILTFDEPADPDASWSVVINGTDEYTTGQWNTSCTQLTIEPAVDFRRNTEVTVLARGFQVSLDNYSFSDANSSFSTVSELPIISATPANGAADIALDTNIVLAFDEPVDTGSSWTVTVNGTDEYTSGSWNDDNTRLTIDPATSFSKDQRVTVTTNGFTASLDGCDFSPITISFGTIGKKILYRASHDSASPCELYVASLYGTGQVKVNGPLLQGRTIITFSWSPDGSRIFYLAEKSFNNFYYLYSVLPDGTGLTQVNNNLVAGGSVQYYKVTGDGSRVIYCADQETDGILELYSVVSDGRDCIKLNGTLNRGVSVHSYDLSPDNSLVAYIASEAAINIHDQLFVVSPDGTGKVIFNQAPDGYVRSFAWSPDGSRILYTVKFYNDDRVRLYSIRPDGTDKILLSTLIYDDSVLSFSWANNSNCVAFTTKDHDLDFYRLYTVQADGKEETLVSGAYNVFNYSLSPDSTKICFVGNSDLFIVPIGGTDIVKLTMYSCHLWLYAWSPDGARIVYQADQQTYDQWELYSILSDGTDLLKLNKTIIAGGDIQSYNNLSAFLFTPDGSRIIYRGDLIRDEKYELFSVAPDGTDNIQLTNSFTGIVWAPFYITADSQRIIYLANHETGKGTQLYSIRPDGTDPIKISNDTGGASIYSVGNFVVQPGE